jgi:dCTP deaminase
MALPDRGIIDRVEGGSLHIDPFEKDNIEPASLDLRLGRDHKKVHGIANNSVESGDDLVYTPIGSDDLLIRPGGFILSTTLERFEFPDDLAARVIGRSSMGRLGLSVHQTAGFIDPGFRGQITLELSNVGPAPIHMEAGDRVCQIIFERVEPSADKTYGHEGSHYQDQTGATPSRKL